jgi:hypothetical protein
MPSIKCCYNFSIVIKSPARRILKRRGEVMSDKQECVVDIIRKVVEEMCDKHCKFPEQYSEEDEEKLYEEHCNNCPLNKLW